MKMQEIIIKYWPSLLILAAGILGAFGAFVASKRTTEKSDQIKEYSKLSKEFGEKNEALGKANKDINKSILELTTVQEKLTKESRVIIEENEKLAKKNIELAPGSTELNEKIIQLTEIVRDLNTGGTSMPIISNVMITQYEDGVQADGDKLHLIVEIRNDGNYALDNLKIRGYEVVSFQNEDPIFLWTQLSLSGLNIYSRFAHFRGPMQTISQQQNPPLFNGDFEVFKPSQRELLGPIRFSKDFENFGINLFIESKRQDWIILLRVYRPKGTNVPPSLKAFKILKLSGKNIENVLTQVDPGFPLDVEGRVKWYKSDLPKEWFEIR